MRKSLVGLLVGLMVLLANPAKAAIEPLPVDISPFAVYSSPGVMPVGNEQGGAYFVMQTDPLEVSVSIEFPLIFGDQITVPSNANGLVLLATPFRGAVQLTAEIGASGPLLFALTGAQGIFLPLPTVNTGPFGFQVTVSGTFDVEQMPAAYFEVLGFNTIPSPVPEPETWIMFLLGFAGIGAVARRQQGRT